MQQVRFALRIPAGNRSWALVAFTVALACGAITLARGQAPVPAPVNPALEVETVTISDFSAEPSSLKPKHGPFILSLINRTRMAAAELILDSPNVPAQQLATVAATMRLSSLRNLERLDSVIDAPPGIYQLKWKATGAVRLTITIE